MVGGLGTEALSGAAICNQLIFIYNISVNGLLAGSSIFTAQFYGKNDEEGIRNTFRYKLIFAGGLAFFTCLILLTAKEYLIGLFLAGSGQQDAIELAKLFARQYLSIMAAGLIPYGISQAFAGTLRETDEVNLPMAASLIAVGVNILLSFCLIYGMMGLPRLGIAGAAVANVIARFLECSILFFWTWRKREIYRFIHGGLRLWEVSGQLFWPILKKGIPNFVNAFVWSAGVTLMFQSFSTRGLSAVVAYNIASTVNGVFANVFGGLSVTLMIMVGQQLGAGRIHQARDITKKLLAFAVVICIFIGSIMAAGARYIPELYNMSGEVKALVIKVILIMASILPCCGFTNCAGNTFRAGGMTLLGFALEGIFTMIVVVPCAYILSRFTQLSFLALYIVCQYTEVIKAMIQLSFIRKGNWARNVVG